MQQLKKMSVILSLIDTLKKHGSWCGETHIQKSLYFLQEFTRVPLGFDFILYKHGPFSFDLRDELSSMQADNMLKIILQPYPYGPSLETTEVSMELRSRFPVTLGKYASAIEFISKNLGTLGVAELERIATALYVTKTNIETDPEKRAKTICQLKPHVPMNKAQEAVNMLDEMFNKFQTIQ